MQISQGFAIFMILFTTFMWGSWFQCIKHLGKLPIHGFMLWLYTFSFVIVWAFMLIFGRFFITVNIWDAVMAQKGTALLVIICGAIFAIGVQLQMAVVKRVGIILATSISSSCSIIIGTIISAIFGGLPEKFSGLLMAVACACIIVAAVTCQLAGKRRNEEKGDIVDDVKFEPKMVVALLCIAIFLAPTYPLAMAVGVKTEYNSTGFEPLLTVALLAVGSLIGSWAFASVVLTKRKEWKATLMPERKIGIGMAAIAAFCHYGGNIIHTIAIPSVSAAIAWPMGTTSSVWSYLWGLLYKEFKGASKKTYVMLFSGIVLFFVGVFLLAINLY